MNLLLWLLVIWLLLSAPGGAQPSGSVKEPAHRQLALLETLPLNEKAKEQVKIDATVLFSCYPEAIAGLDVKKDGTITLRMKNQAAILYDDRRVKNFEERLARPDLEDMLGQAYQPGRPGPNPTLNHDPGRFRVAGFFDAVYGGPATEVQTALAPVQVAGARVMFNSRNGAAQALARVGEKLGELLNRRPELRNYVFPLGGTFAYRRIAGTENKSPHAWGIAFDLNPQKGSYWRWQGGLTAANLLRLQQAFPFELLRLFEESGFIWGGKWWHYDTLHFEYRPELLMKADLLKRAGRRL